MYSARCGKPVYSMDDGDISWFTVSGPRDVTRIDSDDWSIVPPWFTSCQLANHESSSDHTSESNVAIQWSRFSRRCVVLRSVSRRCVMYGRFLSRRTGAVDTMWIQCWGYRSFPSWKIEKSLKVVGVSLNTTISEQNIKLHTRLYIKKKII